MWTEACCVKTHFLGNLLCVLDSIRLHAAFMLPTFLGNSQKTKVMLGFSFQSDVRFPESLLATLKVHTIPDDLGEIKQGMCAEEWDKTRSNEIFSQI